ncbi:hypothetical protein PHISP_05617 [Aspergillus sp. HF37]|nr:hypothetical protein PHISP_05617 [Aspergillus sp. HF37]
MDTHAAKPKDRTARPQPSPAKQNPRPPGHDGTAHSHPPLPGSNRNRSRNPPTPTRQPDAFTNPTKLNTTTNPNKPSLEALGRELYKQHVDDVKYLRKRKEIQAHYRALIEHDRLRCMTELENINAGAAFLARQEQLDRKWEERLVSQRARLGEIRRRLHGVVGMGVGSGGGVQVSGQVTNPLFRALSVA